MMKEVERSVIGMLLKMERIKQNKGQNKRSIAFLVIIMLMVIPKKKINLFMKRKEGVLEH